jgi:acid-sensing ion channel, other
LKFFKVYNRANCEHECLAQITLNACNCVQFYMVRNSSTRICGVADEKCFRKIEESFEVEKEKCKCLQPCERVKYEVEVERPGLDQGYKGFYVDILRSNFHIDFAVDQTFPLIKAKKYSIADILSNVGGMIGLLTGFSFLSFAEILYVFVFKSLFKEKSSKVEPFETKENLPKKVFKTFMQNSSIHSFYYIGNEKRKIEKLVR